MTGSCTLDVRRVSVRELEETPWRALLAAGAAPGEAAYAARSACFTEIHLGAGLQAVPPQLPLVPRSRTPCSLERGTVDVVLDPVDRGLLLLGPIAIGLVATRPVASPVLIPDLAWEPVVAGMLARPGHVGDPALLAFGVDERGEPHHGAMTYPDGGLALLDGDDLIEWFRLHPLLRAAVRKAAPTGGLLFSSDLTRLGVPADVQVTHSAVSMRRRQAETDGVEVEASVWDAVALAARRFLVAER